MLQNEHTSVLILVFDENTKTTMINSLDIEHKLDLDYSTSFRVKIKVRLKCLKNI